MKRKWTSILLMLVLLFGTATTAAAARAEASISGAISESGITVQVENLSGEARLMIAQYHYGQMADVVTENVSCDGSYTITAQKLVMGDEFKLFLMGKSTSAPLCKAALPVQTEDLRITESATYNGGAYRQVIIDESVGNGDVSLENITIYGDLIVQGGGSNTIRMNGCAVHGKVSIDKTPGAGKEPPRLHLTDTSIPVVEATQPAIIEAGDSKSSVGELKASGDVTIQGAKTTVETVTVPTSGSTPTVTVAAGAKIETMAVSPAATANVNVEAGASVVTVEAKGETTISADGTVNSVTANANVTVSSGEVDRVEIPDSVNSAVSITVSESATVNDVTVNTTSHVQINAEGEDSLGSLSTDDDDKVGALKNSVTVVGKGNKGQQPTRTENGLTAGNRCSVCGKTLLEQEVILAVGQHSYTDGNDFDCNACGTFRTVRYSDVFVRTFAREGFETDQLRIEQGEPVFKNIYFNADKCSSRDLPAGWNYGGWNVLIENSEGGRVSSMVYKTLEEAAPILLDAVRNGHIIFLDLTTGAIGMGKNGFDVTFDISSGNLEYALSVPENPEDTYYLKFLCLDHGKQYKASVSKYGKTAYHDIVWAHAITDSGYYNAVEVSKWTGGKENELLASWKLKTPFYVELNSAEISDPVTVSIGEDDHITAMGNIHYVISGLSGGLCYQLHEEDVSGTYSSYGNFTPDAHGNIHSYVSTDHTITHTTLYGTKVFMDDGIRVIEITKPLTLALPAYDGGDDDDTDADWNALLKEAEDLGLLQYLDKNSITAGSEVSRLQISMLAAALYDIDPSSAPAWKFTDGADLTAQQKAIIMALHEDGIVAGYQNGSFQPGGILTNGQAIVILDRVLGMPVVPVKRTNNILPDHWACWPYTMLDNLGIIGCDDVGCNATAADVLQWFINAKNWRTENPTNPSYNVSDIRFASDDALPSSITWTLAPYPDNLTPEHFSYEVELYDSASGESSIYTTEDNFLPFYAIDAGVYTKVTVRTAFKDRYCGEATENDLTLTVNETMEQLSTGSVSPAFHAPDSDLIDLIFEGFSAGQDIYFFVDIDVDTGDRISRADLTFVGKAGANGKCTIEMDEVNSAILREGFNHAIRTCSGVSISGKTASVDIVNHGGWSPDLLINMIYPNVWFEDQFIKWNRPVGAPLDEKLHYEIKLSNSTTQVFANCGTSDTQVAIYAFPAGTYDSVGLVITTHDGEPFSGMTRFGYDLTISESTSSATPEASFNPIVENGETVGYTVSLSGLTPNTSHTVHLVNSPSKWGWNAGNFREVVSDANGSASSEHFGPDVLDLVQNGYLFVFEQTANTVTSTTAASTAAAPIISGMRCTPASNKVWFAAYGDALELHWSYDLPTGSYDHMEMQLSTDNGTTWFSGSGCSIRDPGDTHWLVNSISFQAPESASTTFNKMKLVLVDDAGNGTDWFTKDISLTVNKGGISNATLNISAANDPGFYAFTPSGLTHDFYAVHTSPDGSYNEYDRFFADRATDSTVTFAPYIGTGYWQLREFEVGSVSGTTAAIICYDTVWTRYAGAPDAQMHISSGTPYGQTSANSPEINFDMSFKLSPIGTSEADNSVMWDLLLWSKNSMKLQVYYRDEGDAYWTQLKSGSSDTATFQMTTVMPESYAMSCYFVNTTAPAFIEGYPMAQAGDSDVTIGVELNRPDTRYYCVITEVGNIPTQLADGTSITADNWELLPAGGTAFDGIKDGNISMPSSLSIIAPPYGGSKYIIRQGNYTGGLLNLKTEGLQPDTRYIAYFVLQGSTPDSLSDVFAIRFKTEEALCPILTVSLQNPSALIESTCEADVRYMLIPFGQEEIILKQEMSAIWNNESAAEYGLSAALIAEYQAMTALEAMAVKHYAGGRDCGSVFDLFATLSAQHSISAWFDTARANGSAIAKVGTTTLTNGNLTAEVNCMQDMLPQHKYWFIAMGKSVLGSDCTFSAAHSLFYPELTPPKVVGVSTSVRGIPANSMAEAMNTAYTGSVMLAFDSYLYFRKDNTHLQVVDKPIEAGLDDSEYVSSTVLLASDKMTVDPQVDASEANNPRCNTLALDFADVRVGDTFTFDQNIANSHGVTGSSALSLMLRLVESEGGFIIPEFYITSFDWDATAK